VKPHVPDAWMDRSKDKVGYEINFNRYFYVFTPPRPLAEIDAELKPPRTRSFGSSGR
jgi:type I restriction enzyme M protein